MQMNEQRNLVLAIILSAVILGVFELFFKPGIVAQQKAYVAAAVNKQVVEQQQKPMARTVIARADAIAANRRVMIENEHVKGSINLTGGRIDDMTLSTYRETVDPNSPQIILLSPENTENGYFADFGWAVDEAAKIGPIPDANTVWTADAKTLTPLQPVTLRYDNGAGLVFEKTFRIDDHYMITVEQNVVNQSGKSVDVHPYASIARYNRPHTKDFFVLHEGLLGVVGDVLEEVRYKDIEEKKKVEFESTGGWLGITDKYWLVAVAADNAQKINARFAHTRPQNTDRYQTDYTVAAQTVANGGHANVTHHFFAGAKEVKLLDAYEKQLGIPRFDLAVDFGWYYFLTKPLFLLLHFLVGFLGNFGLAILVLTIIVKGVMFPVANKSYRTMNKLKELQPQLLAMRDQYKDDPMRMQKELAGFYQKQKVNPLSGCLTMFIQIPVFFSLYKVFFVTIEMRHQPFFGWIHDLSAPDPTTVFNLFGMIDWMPPAYFLFIPLHVGAWPILMGFTMWLQMRMNPAPTDPAQKIVFSVFPYLFTFMLASFPAGLVIYWSWSNILGILQQWAIRRHEPKTAAK